ncbi:MAG: TolC family protein [Planctomycetes bacterium]|nr:TolC family protein [Planctomycetota bacterium]
MTKEMYQDAQMSLPKNLENDPTPITTPIGPMTPMPATVTQADRPARYLSLQEAIAIALENGHVSGRSGAGTGRADDNMVSGQSPSSFNSQSERIRVLALNPAISSAAMEAAFARFDPVWSTNVNWTNTDGIPGVINFPGYLGTVSGQTWGMQSSLIKALATGGVAELSFLTDYRLLSNAQNNPFAFGPLNPQWAARVSLGIEQPLWKDWGVEINQLLPRFPSITAQGLVNNTATTAFNQHQGALSSFVDRQSEGILISRLRFDQQRTEFERNVHLLMLQAEVAYWSLYNKYGALYAFEENLRIMHKAWQDNYSQFKAGRLDPEKYYQVLGQYHEFRTERLKALNDVLDAEQQLRGILGMNVEDGVRLVPITPPTVAEFRPDWKTSLEDAINLRPEMQLARDNLRYHQYLLSIQKNSMKPDLRFYARLEPFGEGNTLTGNGTFDASGSPFPSNAFKSLTNSHLLDWQLGLNLNIPLGYRAELAAVRAARLQLTQSYLLLRDQEDKATRFLAGQYRELDHWYERIKGHRMERLGYLDSLKTRMDQINAGKLIIGDPAFLEAQRRYAGALVKEYDAIAQYNSTLARLEWGKGTILRYNNVHISEGALPQCAQVRAVEYEKERTQSLIVRERPNPVYHPGRMSGNKVETPKDLEAPMPLEDAAIESKYKIVPAKHETKWKFSPKPVTTPSHDERWAPSRGEELPLKFVPANSSSAPAPLPKLDVAPPVVPTPLEIGALWMPLRPRSAGGAAMESGQPLAALESRAAIRPNTPATVRGAIPD